MFIEKRKLFNNKNTYYSSMGKKKEKDYKELLSEDEEDELEEELYDEWF